jgi:putative transposase
MEQQTTTHVVSSSEMGERLEGFVREHIQRFIQALLEEEVTALRGRPKSARRADVDVAAGMRNGYGKPRRLSLTAGTICARPQPNGSRKSTSRPRSSGTCFKSRRPPSGA